MNDLFQGASTESNPVECLGQTFPSDAARREHYLKLLAEKLNDPEFRKIEGFPVGTDEAILELSDPPYYTACPNPFIHDFIRYYGRPYDPATPYSKEPFAADVSEGKNDPIYNAHGYHTKVPHKAIMRYILHYTQPGDVILDGFSGTGMTGVAAQLCGDRASVQSLGYRVEESGEILQEEVQSSEANWVRFSSLGARQAILSDLSPAATFITHNYNSPKERVGFDARAGLAISDLENKFGWMYQTLHQPTIAEIDIACIEIELQRQPDFSKFGRVGVINYVVWSDVFNCPECTGEVVF